MEAQILNTLIGNIAYCVWWKDQNSVLLGCNKNLAECLGFQTPEQVIGKTDFDIWEVEEAEQSLKIDQEVISSGKAVLNYVEKKTKKNGETIWFSKSKAPLYDEHNNVIGTIGWHSDITHIKNMELSIDDKNMQLVEYNAQLEKAYRKIELTNIDLENFTYAASHDLKGPIRNIKNFAQLLKAKKKRTFDSESIEYLEVILDSAARMEALVSDVLTFARVGIQEVNVESVDVREVISEKMADLSGQIAEKSVKIVVGFSSYSIKCYPHLIRLVFYNLISNAIKFNESTEPQIEIDLKEEPEYYVFEVKDNGVGIKAEFAEQVFEPFKRLVGDAIPGSGIGLSICKRVIEIHQGEIWVEQNQEKGTTFKFSMLKNL